MNAIEFEAWPKIARLNRQITITEKIDGTNAAVVIVPVNGGDEIPAHAISLIPTPAARERGEGDYALVLAQSRTKFITPGKSTDNYGFAAWVQRNAEALVATLGEGRHFGEWWGAGIQRKYGLTGGDKRFSLFNTHRWSTLRSETETTHTVPVNLEHIPGLGVVPILYRGPYREAEILHALQGLRIDGSAAAPGFMRPEGIIVWHDAARISFKVTLEGDEAPKSLADVIPTVNARTAAAREAAAA